MSIESSLHISLSAFPSTYSADFISSLVRLLYLHVLHLSRPLVEYLLKIITKISFDFSLIPRLNGLELLVQDILVIN